MYVAVLLRFCYFDFYGSVAGGIYKYHWIIMTVKLQQNFV